MSTLGLAVVLVAIAVVAFVGSIRVGILLGRGLDRFVEARRAATSDADPATPPATALPATEATTSGGPTSE